MVRGVRGLTLIELLVAIAIFSVLSGVSYRALTVVLESRSRIDQETRKWREIALFFVRLEQDLATAAPRPVRDAGDRLVPAFVGNAAATRPDETAIQFTRTGFVTDPAAVEPPRRLGYRLRAGAVELLSWNALDPGPQAQPSVTVVLHDVQGLSVRFLDRRGQWVATWPQAGSAAAPTSIPAGVEVAITLGAGERITRLFATSARLPQ
jgi:general secretion pathway protein J